MTALNGANGSTCNHVSETLDQMLTRHTQDRECTTQSWTSWLVLMGYTLKGVIYIHTYFNT